jgi:acyl-coenzyme A thioesterase PaaI-like protein
VSLISEALRKARQDAATREAADRGQGIPSMVVRPRHRSPLGVGLVVGAVIALAAAMAGAAAVWWAVNRRGETVTAVAASEQGATEAVETTSPGEQRPAVAAAGAAERERSAGSTSASALSGAMTGTETDRVVERADPTAVLAPPQADAVADVVDDEVPAAADPTEPADAEPPSPRPGDSSDAAPPSAGERVFVIDADLGYATLSLDFIVFRSQDPFAEINGTEVHEGNTVEGFVVERIERDRVVLRDDNGPVVLRVR